jgi:hypothetical protein
MSGAGLDYEGTIRNRIKLGPEQVAQVAEWAEMPTETESVAAMLAGVAGGYIASRIAEVARTFPPHRDAVLASDPWADWRTDDGWDVADHHNLLGRGRGQPRNAALIDVHDILAAWWDDLPPPSGARRRNLWRPQFDKIEDQMVAANETAIIFAYVARALDPTNTPRNCNAVVSFVKDRARSDAAKVKRRKARAAYARQRQNKPPSE